jgi:glucokinase
LAQKTWSTVFPQQTLEFVFLAAHVDGTDLLRELLRNATFTPDDLAELSSSEIPELRQAAQERLARIQSNPK